MRLLKRVPPIKTTPQKYFINYKILNILHILSIDTARPECYIDAYPGSRFPGGWRTGLHNKEKRRKKNNE